MVMVMVMDMALNLGLGQAVMCMGVCGVFPWFLLSGCSGLDSLDGTVWHGTCLVRVVSLLLPMPFWCPWLLLCCLVMIVTSHFPHPSPTLLLSSHTFCTLLHSHFSPIRSLASHHITSLAVYTLLTLEKGHHALFFCLFSYVNEIHAAVVLPFAVLPVSYSF